MSPMLILLLRLLSHLPLVVLHAVGALAGVLAYCLVPGFREKTEKNLKAAGLYSRALAWTSSAEAGKGTLETCFIWFRSQQALARISDDAGLRRALADSPCGADGPGRIFLTPHIGSFELSAKLFAVLGPITVLYKPPRREDLHALLRAARTAPGLTAVPADASGVRALVRALRRGESIGILPDQVPTAGDGAWAPFFGLPAFTMTLPARLAERTGAPVFLVSTLRLPRARGWRIDVSRFDGLPTPERVNHAIERVVAAAPSQYYWSYNRYKLPPGKPQPQGAAT